MSDSLYVVYVEIVYVGGYCTHKIVPLREQRSVGARVSAILRLVFMIISSVKLTSHDYSFDRQGYTAEMLEEGTSTTIPVKQLQSPCRPVRVLVMFLLDDLLILLWD